MSQKHKSYGKKNKISFILIEIFYFLKKFLSKIGCHGTCSSNNANRPHQIHIWKSLDVLGRLLKY